LFYRWICSIAVRSQREYFVLAVLGAALGSKADFM
jgi:hypothetical protein